MIIPHHVNHVTQCSCVCSAALSIKMNVLLFFPAFGVLLWQSLGAWSTLFYLCVIAGIQVREREIACHRCGRRFAYNRNRWDWHTHFWQHTPDPTWLVHLSLAVYSIIDGLWIGAWWMKRCLYPENLPMHCYSVISWFCSCLWHSYGAKGEWCDVVGHPWQHVSHSKCRHLIRVFIDGFQNKRRIISVDGK